MDRHQCPLRNHILPHLVSPEQGKDVCCWSPDCAFLQQKAISQCGVSRWAPVQMAMFKCFKSEIPLSFRWIHHIWEQLHLQRWLINELPTVLALDRGRLPSPERLLTSSPSWVGDSWPCWKLTHSLLIHLTVSGPYYVSGLPKWLSG